MRDVLGRVGPWVALPAAAILILVAACDQDWAGPVDAGPDIMVDLPGDTLTDPPADTSPADTSPADTVEEDPSTPCTHPEGPWAFNAVGNIVGPMRWPSAIAGSEETSEAADLEAFHCDPSVHSVFVQIVTTT